MAEIRPFRALRYNPAVAGDLAGAICPPYDVISPEQQAGYHERTPYNVIRLEYGLTQPGDTSGSTQYTRAAQTLAEWLAKGVLAPEQRPALYVHEHTFRHRGATYMKTGIVCRAKLVPWSEGQIKPHENTRPGAKADRLRLMQACPANFSSVYGLFAEQEGRLAELIAEVTKVAPAVDIDGYEDDHHRLWVVDAPDAIEVIRSAIDRVPIYIADGHHRYETALTYREERLREGPATGNEPWNFVMMTLVEMTDPGLLVLPIHRLIKGVDRASSRELRARLAEEFSIEAVGIGDDVREEQMTGLLAELRQRGADRPAFAVCGLDRGRVLLVSAKQPGPSSGSPRARLDVTALHERLLEPALGLKVSEPNEERLVYTADPSEALARVRSREFDLAFLLNPVPVTTIAAVADAGEKMPAKSTYFYPKLPTGFVISYLEEGY